jgi:hypothetical protein
VVKTMSTVMPFAHGGELKNNTMPVLKATDKCRKMPPKNHQERIQILDYTRASCCDNY